jgi:membrane protease YdiL (CAAX protease family)
VPILVALGAGLTLLASRVALIPLGPPRAPLTLLIFGSILIASLSIPARERPRAGGMVLAAVAGAATLGLGAAWMPPVTPLPPTVAAIPFALLGATAEEAFFRRAAFGAIERAVPGRSGTAVAVVATGIAFAAIHVPLYGTAALPLDLGAGLLLSWQRAVAGTWTVPLATHAAANALAVLA